MGYVRSKGKAVFFIIILFFIIISYLLFDVVMDSAKVFQ